MPTKQQVNRYVHKVYNVGPAGKQNQSLGIVVNHKLAKQLQLRAGDYIFQSVSDGCLLIQKFFIEKEDGLAGKPAKTNDGLDVRNDHEARRSSK